MEKLSEQLKNRIESMSDEELRRKFEELEPLNGVGPTVEDYLSFLEDMKKQDSLQGVSEDGEVDLCVTEVLEWYDIPQLFTAADANGNSYVCVVYDVTESGRLLAIGMPMTTEELVSFVAGKTELLPLMKSADASGNVYDVAWQGSITARPRTEPIEDRMLCDEGYYCKRQTE